MADSHGDRQAIERVLTRCDGHIDMFVFLGDGLRDAQGALELFPALPRVVVRGNCDMLASAGFPEEMKFEADGVTFLAMHGHRFGVKGGLGEAAAHAAQNGANVLLYGHTHIKDDRLIETADGAVRAINPGSAGRGERTFALVETVGGALVCGFGEV